MAMTWWMSVVSIQPLTGYQVSGTSAPTYADKYSDIVFSDSNPGEIRDFSNLPKSCQTNKYIAIFNAAS